MKKLTKLSLLALFAMLTFSISSCHKDLESDIKDLQDKQAMLVSTADMTAKIEAINKQKEELEKKVDAHKNELQKSLDATTSKVSSLETKLSALEAAGATKVELEKVAEELKAEVTARALLAAKVDGIDLLVNTAIADLDAAKAAIIANKEKLEALEKAIELNASNIESNAGNIESNAGNIGLNTAEIAKNAEAIAKADLKLTTEILRIDGAISTLNTELGELNTELTGKINTVAADLEEAITDFENVKAKVLEEQIRINGELGRLAQEDENILKAIEKLKEMTSGDFANISGLIDALKSDVQADFEGVRTEIAEVTSSLEALEVKLEEGFADVLEKVGVLSDDIKALETKLEEGLAGVLVEVGGLMDALEVRIEEKITSLIGRVDALEGRIQAINFVSDYSDGNATVNILEATDQTNVAYSDLSLRFRVYPASKAAGIAADYITGKATLSLSLNSVKTRANVASIAVKSVKQDANGDLIVTATPSNWNITDTDTYSMSLDVVYGVDNTSSNIFAVVPNVIEDTDLDLTRKDSEIGKVGIFDYEILFDNANAISIDDEFFFALFEANNLVGKVADFFDPSLINYSISHAASTVVVGGGTGITTEEVGAETLTKAKANNFIIDTVKRTVQLDKTDVTTFIGNTLTLTVSAKVGDKEIATTDITFTVISKPTFKDDISAFDITWAEDFDNAVYEIKLAPYEEDVKAALANGLTLTFDGATSGSSDPFTITWDNSSSKLRVTPTKDTKWVDDVVTPAVKENVYSKIVVKAQHPTSKRNVEITLLAVNTKLPVVTYTKADIFWKGNSMVVEGKYTGAGTSASKITDFVMEGDATKGFAASSDVPAGVTLEVVEHTAVTDISYAQSVVTYAKNKYFTTDEAKTAIAKAELVYTSTTSDVDPVRIPVTGFEQFNIIPSDVIKEVKNTLADKTIELSSAKTTASLDNYLSFKDIRTSSELRQVATDLATVAATQDEYYAAVGTYGTDKTWEIFGLTNAAELDFGDVTYANKTFGAFYEVGDIKHANVADGEIDAASKKAVEDALSIGTKDTNGKLVANFGSMQLQKDVIVTINVTVHTFWNQYTTTIPVKLTRN